jgi:glyoxylase-like metal-dependent hydrolase (beta-lactamase superfamily II)
MDSWRQHESLWGEFLPVPPEQLSVLEDGQTIAVDGLEIHPLDTPGHAYHHFAYLFKNICFREILVVSACMV